MSHLSNPKIWANVGSAYFLCQSITSTNAILLQIVALRHKFRKSESKFHIKQMHLKIIYIISRIILCIIKYLRQNSGHFFRPQCMLKFVQVEFMLCCQRYRHCLSPRSPRRQYLMSSMTHDHRFSETRGPIQYKDILLPGEIYPIAESEIICGLVWK